MGCGDAVVRLHQYQATHPRVLIEHRTAPAWHWRACWADADGTRREVADLELAGLLDALDALDGPEGPGGP